MIPPQERVAAIGELNPDIITSGPNELQFGREVLRHHDLRLGSSSAIFASGLARLGARVDFVGKVGNDIFGKFVMQELKKNHVGTKHVIVDPSVKTGSTIVFSIPKDKALDTDLGAMAEFGIEDINLALLNRYKHLHVSSFFLQPKFSPDLYRLFQEAKSQGLTTSLDPNWDPDEKWDHNLIKALCFTDYFLPNEEEAKAITGKADVEEAAEILSKIVRTVVVKRGERGLLARSGDIVLQSPAIPIDVVDTTGAGDSTNAGFIYAYILKKMPLEDSLLFANICGALSTRGFGGTATQPTLAEVTEVLHQVKPSTSQNYR